MSPFSERSRRGSLVSTLGASIRLLVESPSRRGTQTGAHTEAPTMEPEKDPYLAQRAPGIPPIGSGAKEGLRPRLGRREGLWILGVGASNRGVSVFGEAASPKMASTSRPK